MNQSHCLWTNWNLFALPSVSNACFLYFIEYSWKVTIILTHTVYDVHKINMTWSLFKMFWWQWISNWELLSIAWWKALNNKYQQFSITAELLAGSKKVINHFLTYIESQGSHKNTEAFPICINENVYIHIYIYIYIFYVYYFDPSFVLIFKEQPSTMDSFSLLLFSP